MTASSFCFYKRCCTNPPLCASFYGGYQEERLLPNHSRERRTKLEVSLPVFRPYYKIAVIKTVWLWHKNRCTDWWNRIEHPEINPHLYGQLTCNKGGENIQCGKDNLFNMWYWEHSTDEGESNGTAFLTPYTNKQNSKWIKSFNLRLETTESLEENVGSALFDISFSSIFLDLFPQARATKINN